MSSQGSSISKKLHSFELPKFNWQTVCHNPRSSIHSSKVTSQSPQEQPSPPVIAAAPIQSPPVNSATLVQLSLGTASPSSLSSPFMHGFVSQVETFCIDKLKSALPGDEKNVENEGVKDGKYLPDSEKLTKNLAETLEEAATFSSMHCADGSQRKLKDTKQPKLAFRRSEESTEAVMVEEEGKVSSKVKKDKEKGKQLVKADGEGINPLLKKDKEVKSIKDVESIEIGGADDKSCKKWNFRDRKPVQSSNTASANRIAGSPYTAAGNKVQQAKLEKEEGKRSNIPKFPSFSLELKPEEIAADLLAMTGKIPSRKPKKRAKNVQRQLDLLTPGGNLETITINQYKVSENTRKGK